MLPVKDPNFSNVKLFIYFNYYKFLNMYKVSHNERALNVFRETEITEIWIFISRGFGHYWVETKYFQWRGTYTRKDTISKFTNLG